MRAAGVDRAPEVCLCSGEEMLVAGDAEGLVAHVGASCGGDLGPQQGGVVALRPEGWARGDLPRRLVSGSWER
eukprot:15465617-Alexandrium_andersonii.AAC.1